MAKGGKYSTEIKVFLGIWLVYALHIVPGGGVNPNRYFDLTYSMMEQHTLNIDAYHENTRDKGFKDGHYYSAGLPGPSLLGIPAYVAFQAAAHLMPAKMYASLSSIKSFQQDNATGFYRKDNTLFFLSTIWITLFTLSTLSAVAATALFRLLQQYGVAKPQALGAALFYAFGTPIFFYSTTYFSHVFTSSLVIFVLLLLSHCRLQQPGWRWVALGLLTGTTLLMEYWSVAFIGFVGLYVLLRWRWRPSILYACGALVPCLILAAYNTSAFGGPLHAPHQYLVGDDSVAVHGVGWLGFMPPTPHRLWGLTFSFERGIFVFSPILLLALVGWWYALRDRKRRDLHGMTVLSIACATAIWMMVASYMDWKGGAAFGPRQILMILPFMFIGVGVAMSRVSKWIWLPLGLLSVATNWIGAQYGVVENFPAAWRMFVAQGFTLPAIDAIVSHSRTGNTLLAMVQQYHFLIVIGYWCLIGALALQLGRLTRETAR